MSTKANFDCRNGFLSANRAICLAAALLLTVGCGDDGDDDGGTDGGDSTALLTSVIDYVGGDEAVRGLTGFTSEATGTRALAGEGINAGDPAVEVSTFTTTTYYDIANDTIRIDYQRTIGFLGGAQLVYSEIYDGDLGYIEGDDNFLVPGPTDAPMLSSRVVSGRTQLAFLNPHILLADVIAETRTATESSESIAGCDGVLDISDDVSTIQLCVAASGEITKAITMVNDFLHRDVAFEVTYGDWAGDPVKFPGTVTINLNGDDVHTETRTVTVNPTFAVSFALPDGGAFDAELATFGENTHQWFQGFLSLGIALDARLTFVQSDELAPGVFHLTGGSHHSLVVEQSDHLIIAEAPNYPERSDAILAWAAAEFPDKPVTHVIATHHHEDHTAGLRSFVAAGITVVLHEDSEEFFRDEVFAAPSTIVPDSLAATPMAPTFAPVAAAGLELGDDITITLSHLPTSHSNDMLLIHVGAGGGIVFQSDLYNPGNGGAALSPVFPAELLAAINGGLETATIAGGHAGVAPLSELEAFVAALTIK
ncbi:MAG: MBL fold metallo-hydrolase [Myxococcota bacterium]